MDTLEAPIKDKARPSKWHSRGYLPHLDSESDTQAVTFRLFDAVPQSVIDNWKAQLASSSNPDAELRKRIEKYSDVGYGSCYLRNPSVASIIQNSILHFDGIRYRMHSWVVMPNHVHLLFTPREGYKLKRIMHTIKSYTSSEANKLLGRSGRFWMKEYFDRFVRNERHFNNAVRYVEQNPVKAGLCRKAEDWPWGSARWEAEWAAAQSFETEP